MLLHFHSCCHPYVVAAELADIFEPVMLFCQATRQSFKMPQERAFTTPWNQPSSEWE